MEEAPSSPEGAEASGGAQVVQGFVSARGGAAPGRALAAQGPSSGIKSANLRHFGCSGSLPCANQRASAGPSGGSGLKRLEEATQHPWLCPG